MVPLHLWFIFCKGALLSNPETHILKVCVCFFRVLEERTQGAKEQGGKTQGKGEKWCKFFCALLEEWFASSKWSMWFLFFMIENWADNRARKVQVTEGVTWLKCYWDNPWGVGLGLGLIQFSPIIKKCVSWASSHLLYLPLASTSLCFSSPCPQFTILCLQ